jgi:outer membrane lipoprotein-sorting protein
MKRMRIVRNLLLGLLAAALPAAAQSTDEIVNQHIEARGGLEKIQSVNSARIVGKMTMGPGMEAPVVLEWKRPESLRLEFVVQGMTGVMTYDGKSGWMLMPFMGKTAPEPVPEEQLKDLAEQADFDGPLVGYQQKGHQVEYLGEDTIEGTPVHKLRLTKKSGDVSTIYLDKDAFLEIKQEASRETRGQQVEIEVTTGDYKEVDGLVLAHSVENRMKGAPVGQTITIETVELNPALEDSRFTMTPADGSDAPAPAAPAGSEPGR